ncbi:peptidylprolyl isomerase [Candidatus Woesearchaeota archaeon]|nr:peptidylprolyl isomerase [Candidatus Woesearchaeota archaeon]MBS3142465.1 peptidylprolyl isomerase [Candidatus Woesearchaeota archaeon]
MNPKVKKKAQKPSIHIKYDIEPPQPISIKELKDEPMETKTSHKTPAKKKKSSRIFLWISLIIVLALIILIINLDRLVPKQQSSMAATINGESISIQDLEKMYKLSVPEAFRSQISRDMFLNRSLVPQRLLLQEAKKAGVDKSQEEAAAAVEQWIVDSGLDRAQFDERLSKDGLTVEDVQEFFRQTMIVNAFFNSTVLKDVEIELPERVKASHILLANESAANAVKDELELGADFGELALQYSLDPSAKLNKGDLGYFTKDAMVEPFANAAFALEVGEISDPVESQFGFHVIKVYDHTQPGKVKYSELTSDEDRTKAFQEHKDTVDTFLDVLRSRSEISIFGNETVAAPPAIATVDTASLIACLVEKNATVYVSTWCKTCPEQKAILGDDIATIKTVVCSTAQDQSQTAECEALGIEGYPTWIVNGNMLKGVQSIDQLKLGSGC